ncbi:MAG: response regulator [Phycisphaerae bacterium]|nr:response regulator [Phycisphaerae bacterium]
MCKTVLVVDDEIHIVYVVAIKLRNNGFNVITAENGEEAYELVKQEKPDLVVTDYQMPKMTGIELIEKLRQDEQTKQLPVIMLTARNFVIEDELKNNLNISECIGKPFSPKDLLHTIEDVLHEGAIVS